MKPKYKPTDYVAIDLWHKSSGSYQYYIDDMQERASTDNAPLDALYYSDLEKKWICVSDLSPDHPFRQQLAAYNKNNS